MIEKSVPENNNYSRFLILSACLLLLLSFGYRSSFGLFVKPITAANGWGREVISVALALQNLFWGIFAVFAGGMADRFGNVKVIVAGTILYALGIMLMSGVDNPWMLNLSTGLLVGAGVAGTSFGIVFLGHQIGSFIGVWLGGWLYDTSGSYTAVWWLSVVLGIMAAIVHWPIQERPVGRFAPQKV